MVRTIAIVQDCPAARFEEQLGPSVVNLPSKRS